MPCLKSVQKQDLRHKMTLDFDTEYILENEVVFLRPLTGDDVIHLKAFAENEPELWVFSLLSASSLGIQKYVEISLANRANKKDYPFIIFDKRTGQYAGSTRFYDIQPLSDNLQLGFTWYGKAFQGTGLNKHCKFLLLQFAFESMHVQRVEFRADNKNIRSIAAMKSIGCTQEGILRSNGYCADGSRRDSIIFSILKEEWYGDVKASLYNKLKF